MDPICCKIILIIPSSSSGLWMATLSCLSMGKTREFRIMVSTVLYKVPEVYDLLEARNSCYISWRSYTKHTTSHYQSTRNLFGNTGTLLPFSKFFKESKISFLKKSKVIPFLDTFNSPLFTQQQVRTSIFFLQESTNSIIQIQEKSTCKNLTHTEYICISINVKNH
jgi:hypothetical protein